MRGSIKAGDIDVFRVGDYEKADKTVKKNWLKMLDFVPVVNSEYLKDTIRVNKSLTNAVSASDEALVYWILKNEAPAWEEEFEEQLEYERNNEGRVPPRKKKKQVWAHKSRTELEVYVNLLLELGNKRQAKDELGITTWDMALMNEAKRLFEAENQKLGKNTNYFGEEDKVRKGAEENGHPNKKPRKGKVIVQLFDLAPFDPNEVSQTVGI